MNKSVHQWVFPCKYSILPKTCSFLQFLRKAFNCYQKLQALTLTNTMIHWLSSFTIPGRTTFLKRMNLIDVLKFSFFSVVPVWTNIVYTVQKKETKMNIQGNPKKKKLSELKFLNICTLEKWQHVVCFSWTALKATFILIYNDYLGRQFLTQSHGTGTAFFRKRTNCSI